MSVLKARDVRRQVGRIREACAWLDDHAEEIAERAGKDTGGGFVSSHEVGGRTGHADPTAALAFRPDVVARIVAHLRAGLGQAADAVAGAERAGRSLLPLGQDEAARLLDRGAGGVCGNAGCGVWVPGSAGDRLRSGRCEACYRWWVEHGRVGERPRSLCHPGEEAVV